MALRKEVGEKDTHRPEGGVLLPVFLRVRSPPPGDEAGIVARLPDNLAELHPLPGVPPGFDDLEVPAVKWCIRMLSGPLVARQDVLDVNKNLSRQAVAAFEFLEPGFCRPNLFFN